MKNKIHQVLTKKYVVVLTMLITPLLGFIDRNFVFFSALSITFSILWSSNFKWSAFGFGKKLSFKTILNGLLIAVVLFVITEIGIDPLLQKFLGPIDLSSVDDIRGNFIGFAVLMVIVWVFAALGEELLFRGYYMKGLAELLGDTARAWLVSGIIVSIYFGVSHFYQGPAGIVSVALAGLQFALLFFLNRDNLALVIMVHGFYDTIALTLIYLNLDGMLLDWAHKSFLIG